MKWGAGGRIVDHRMTFEGYFRAGTKVELRGPCYSACTLLLGYMEKANLCIAAGAFMAFHAARGEKYPIFMVGETRAMYETSLRRKSGAGSITTAVGKICRSTAFGRCTIIAYGRSAIPGARHDPASRK